MTLRGKKPEEEVNRGAEGTPFLPYDSSVRGAGCWYPYGFVLHASPLALSKKGGDSEWVIMYSRNMH